RRRGALRRSGRAARREVQGRRSRRPAHPHRRGKEGPGRRRGGVEAAPGQGVDDGAPRRRGRTRAAGDAGASASDRRGLNGSGASPTESAPLPGGRLVILPSPPNLWLGACCGTNLLRQRIGGGGWRARFALFDVATVTSPRCACRISPAAFAAS